MTIQPAFASYLAFWLLLWVGVAHAQDAPDAVPRINALIREGEYEVALRACNDFIERAPNYRELERVRFMRAQCNSALGNTAEAAKNIDEYIERYPESGRGYFGRAWLKCQTVDFEGAVNDFETGFRQGSESIESETRGGFAPYSMDWNKLDKALEDRLAREPTDRVHLFVRALAKIERRNNQGAVDDLTALITAHPLYAYARHARGNAHWNLRRVEPTVEDFEVALKLEPIDIGAGQMVKIAKKLLEGSNRLNEMIAAQPESAALYVHRGSFRTTMHDFAGAVRDFDRALEIEPANVGALTNRAAAKVMMQDFTGAIKDFDVLIPIDSMNLERSLHERASCKSKTGDYAGAIEDYDRLVATMPPTAYLYRLRGIAKSNMNDFAEALKDFDEAIKLGDQPSRHERAHTRLLQKDYAGVFEETDALIRQDPKHPEAYQIRAHAWRRMQKFTEGIEELNKAIGLNAKSPGNFEQRGYCKLYLRDYVGAVADFDQALNVGSSRNAHCGKAVVLAIADSDLRNPTESLRIAEEALSKNPNGYDQNAKACALAALGKFTEAIDLEESISDPLWLKDDELLGGIIAPERIAAWKACKQWQPLMTK